MADRLMVIAQLGQLIGEAEQRGDDRAASWLRNVLELIDSYGVADRALSGRRSSDAERQRRRREKLNESHRSNVTSRDSRDGSQGFPGPLPNSTTTPDTPRASAEDALTETTRALVADRMGAEFTDVETFLSRRERSTWHAWLKEILVMLNGRALPCDVAAACRDDATLERQIGSAKAFRFFVNSAVEERLMPGKRTAAGGSVAPIGARAFHSTLDAIKDL